MSQLLARRAAPIWTSWPADGASWSRRRAGGRSCSSAASALEASSSARARRGGSQFTVLVQGRDLSRIELRASSASVPRAVLFGLKSFWEGVDVQGEALSLVVIDKLPFDPPDDPVHEARVNDEEAGDNWFGGYVLPQAILRLKQGIGRLLRTPDDRGVMAILDKRLYTKSYGARCSRAAPAAHHRIEDVRASSRIALARSCSMPTWQLHPRQAPHQFAVRSGSPTRSR